MLSIKRAFKIIGTGTSFPANKATSEMLEKNMEYLKDGV